DHDSVAGCERQRFGEPQPRELPVGIEHAEPGAVLARADVNLHAAAAHDLLARHALHTDVDGRRTRPLAGADQRVTAREVAVLHSNEIERDTVARTDVVHVALCGLDAAHAHPRPA